MSRAVYMWLVLWLGCTRETPVPEAQDLQALPSAPVAQQAAPGAPNVLLISLDTVRPDHTSIYGYSRDTMPRLGALAKQGAVFEHAYAQAPSTSPTHASMFTGLYPSTHGYYSYKFKLDDKHVTLSEHFRAAGYRTFGAASSVKFVERTGLQQGFDDFHRIGGPKNSRSAEVNARVTAHMTAKSVQPFFGFVHYFDAHAPYDAPDPFLAKWHPRLSNPAPEWTARFIKKNRRDRTIVTPVIATYLKGLYDGELSYLDTFLGNMLASVPQTGDRSTLVVITSDHGEAFFEHNYLGHSHVLYEEIMRVPLVVWWPGKVAAGQRLSVPTQTVDLLPTIMELAGLAVPDGLEGRSLAAPLLGTGPEPEAASIFLQSPKFFGLIDDLPSGRYKLSVRLKNQAPRLVNLTKDPGGLNDLAETHVTELQAMNKRISALPFEDPRGRSVEREEIDAAELEELKALGYVE